MSIPEAPYDRVKLKTFQFQNAQKIPLSTHRYIPPDVVYPLFEEHLFGSL